jgi:hypothetical protein
VIGVPGACAFSTVAGTKAFTCEASAAAGFQLDVNPV